jgi:hypothetical protein
LTLLSAWDDDKLPLELAQRQEMGLDLYLTDFSGDDFMRLRDTGSNAGQEQTRLVKSQHGKFALRPTVEQRKVAPLLGEAPLVSGSRLVWGAVPTRRPRRDVGQRGRSVGQRAAAGRAAAGALAREQSPPQAALLTPVESGGDGHHIREDDRIAAA